MLTLILLGLLVLFIAVCFGGMMSLFTWNVNYWRQGKAQRDADRKMYQGLIRDHITAMIEHPSAHESHDTMALILMLVEYRNV